MSIGSTNFSEGAGHVAVRRWNHAREADVVVMVGMIRDRYALGEVVISAAYHYPDGSVRHGDSHRVAVGPGAQRAVPRIWDKLLEEVMRVQEELPKSVALKLDITGMNGWRVPIATLVRVVAHELSVTSDQ